MSLSNPADLPPEERNERELNVAEDLEFQHRWWRFERIIWIFFVVVLGLDLSGLLGQGPLSKAQAKTTGGGMTVIYQRIERLNTPSKLTVRFGSAAVVNGRVELWVSNSILKKLGAQRIIPEPASSLIDTYGIVYSWPASAHPNAAAFVLDPNAPGMTGFTVVLPATGGEIHRRIFIMP